MSQLKFKSITIANFKTFVGGRTFELERKPGLYYVTGKNLVNPELGANGVGKSTLWDAMVWCLWGKTARDNRPADAIRPWSGEKNTSVHLMFERGHTEYSLERTRNPNHLTLWTINGDGPDSEREIQQEEVPKILGMSEAMFRRTMVLGQFGSLFLDEKPEAQAQMFTEALNLDIWVQAREVANKAGTAAARTAVRYQADVASQVRLLDDIANDIDDATQRSNLFEEDKAARVKKIERGIATLVGDLVKLEEAPVLQPKLPNVTKAATLQSEQADLKAKLGAETQKLSQAKSNLEDTIERIEAFDDEKKVCESCGQSLSNKKFQEQLDAAKAVRLADESRVQELTSTVSDLREKSSDLNIDIELALTDQQSAMNKYRSLMTEHTNYTAELTAVRAELQRQRTALKDAQTAENTAAQELERFRTKRQSYRAMQGTLKESLAQAQREQQAADYWADAFREIRLGIIDSALMELEMAASRHAAMLGLDNWGIKFETERETTSGKVSYTFNVMLFPPGQDEAVKWESYSGGESQRWQLAVAFALSEVLLARAGLSPNLEVLDEPTRGLSSDGVSDLLDHLRDRALELGRAIYFVDHHSLDKGAFDATLMVEKDKKGSSFRWL